jgi:hypothetical protein
MMYVSTNKWWIQPLLWAVARIERNHVQLQDQSWSGWEIDQYKINWRGQQVIQRKATM